MTAGSECNREDPDYSRIKEKNPGLQQYLQTRRLRYDSNVPGTQTIFTIGHSTRPLEEFVELLKFHQVRAIADVRQIPKSRRYPHFADTALGIELPRSGIAYLSFKSLGGRRRARKDSVNMAWRNASFRGYADFMQTQAFADALEELMGEARKQPTAIMCAEAVPWRCHRSLISDALLVRGWQVLDIIGLAKPKPHTLPDFARVSGTQITYPALVEQGLFTLREAQRPEKTV